MDSSATAGPASRGSRHVGPPLLPLALISVALPGAVMFLGLHVAGIAIPAAVDRLLPRPLWIAGIAFAAIAELSTIALLSKPAAVLLPIGRFGSLAWLIAAAALLPASRPRTAPITPKTDEGITP